MCCSHITCDVFEQVLCSPCSCFHIAKSFCMIPILFSHRLFRIIYFSYTKVVGGRFYEDCEVEFFWRCQSSDIFTDFTRNVFALILIFSGSCFESLMEFYRMVFRFDHCEKRFRRFLRGILMTYLFLDRNESVNQL